MIIDEEVHEVEVKRKEPTWRDLADASDPKTKEKLYRDLTWIVEPF